MPIVKKKTVFSYLWILWVRCVLSVWPCFTRYLVFRCFFPFINLFHCLSSWQYDFCCLLQLTCLYFWYQEKNCIPWVWRGDSTVKCLWYSPKIPDGSPKRRSSGSRAYDTIVWLAWSSIYVLHRHTCKQSSYIHKTILKKIKHAFLRTFSLKSWFSIEQQWT